MTYDQNGNLLQDGKYSYTYNALNQLTQIAGADYNASYGYNGDGLRTSVTDSVYGEIRFLWDGENIVLETDGSGQLRGRNVYGLDRISRIQGPASPSYSGASGDAAYYLYNGHGDVTGLMNQQGSILGGYSYDVWGSILSQDGASINPFTYAGEYTDPTGLQYLRARYYNPETGRFLTEDSYTGQLSSPGSLNLYTYVQNNPLGYTDPSGHISVDVNWQGSWDFLKGEAQGVGDFAGSTIEGIANTVQHPIQTAKGIGNAVVHPVFTGRAIANSIKQGWEQDWSGPCADDQSRGRSFMNGLLTVGSLVTGGGAAKSAVGSTRKTSRLARAADAERMAVKGPGEGLTRSVGHSTGSIDPVKFDRMKTAFEKQGGVIDQSDEAMRYLDYRGAEAVTWNEKTIQLRQSPTTSAVFEEFIHTAQYRAGKIPDQTPRTVLTVEIEAAEKLINYRKAYGIPNVETRATIERLRRMRQELDELGK